MTIATLEAQARQHWTEYLPQKTADLRSTDQFQEAVRTAAVRAQQLIEELMEQGAKLHEAEEVALHRFILLPPEAASERDWEAEELAEIEARYQETMREPAQDLTHSA